MSHLLFKVALNVCGGLTGLIQAGTDGYVIEPVRSKLLTIESEHIVTKVPKIPRNVDVAKDKRRVKRVAQGTFSFVMCGLWIRYY